MIERLAVPAWGTAPKTLDDWSAALGEGCAAGRDPDGSAWIALESVGLSGFGVIEGGAVVAIDFTLDAPDPAPALEILESAAGAIGWELHEEDGEDDD